MNSYSGSYPYLYLFTFNVKKSRDAYKKHNSV